MALFEGREAVGRLLVRVPGLGLKDKAAVRTQALEDLGEEGDQALVALIEVDPLGNGEAEARMSRSGLSS
jgi:hypothetical protein